MRKLTLGLLTGLYVTLAVLAAVLVVRLAPASGVAIGLATFIGTLVAVRHAQDPQPLVAVGRWPGEVLTVPRGEQGFGYDPLMFIPDLNCTVAEMDATLKNQHSHRSRAMAQLQALMREVWSL